MSQPGLSHRVVRSSNLAYVSNLSPTSTDPCFLPGSTDLLTSINGYAARRPGFSDTVETTPTTFNNLQRTFTWDRTDGAFIVMFCDVNASNQAQVYKMVVGTDASAVSIFTDTGSATPFDFVVSNNTLYFSNGHVAKAWDPVNGVRNWGIAIGSVNNAVGPNTAGAGTDNNTQGRPWTNPSNVTSTVSYAVFTGARPSDQLDANTFGFSIPSTAPIFGIQIAFEAFAPSGTNTNLDVTLLKGGNTVPVGNTVTLTTSNQTFTLGGQSSLFGTTWTPNDVNASNFGVRFVASGLGAGSVTEEVRNVRITVYSLGGPSVSTTGSGSLSAYNGYQYVFTYGNSNSGGISSPSPVSASTGAFGGIISTTTLAKAGSGYAANDTGIISAGNFNATYKVLTVTSGVVSTYSITANGTGYAVGNNISTSTAGAQPGTGTGLSFNITAVTGVASVQLTLTASTDPQVNQIHAYRSTDSVPPGITAGTFFELPNSPFPNANAVISDTAADTALIVDSVAPTKTFNDPPTPGRSAVYFSGRIWMISGNKVWFSSLEESIAGVPEENWPSGVAGNFWAFDQFPQALAVAGSGTDQTLIILCGGREYGITGNSLDTFRRFVINNRRGTRNLVTVTQLGGLVAWLDSASQIWATDGNNSQELSVPIRPDIKGLNPANCSMSFHVEGDRHWLVFSAGTKLFVYDLDTEQWMPPWTFACQYLYSGEISPGTYKLMAATATKAVQLTSAIANNDQGAFYTPIIRTNQFAVVPDFGTHFSLAAQGFYDEPSKTGLAKYFQVDTNAFPLADVALLTDEDATNQTVTYNSIFTQQTTTGTAWNRSNGTYLVQNVFGLTKPTARWVSWQIKGLKEDDTFRVYGWFVAYEGK